MTQPAGKICVVCSANCAGRPRVKDPKGRYYCRACYEELQQKAIEDSRAGEAAEEWNPYADLGSPARENLLDLEPVDDASPVPVTQRIAPRQTRVAASTRSKWPLVVGLLGLGWGGLTLLIHGAGLLISTAVAADEPGAVGGLGGSCLWLIMSCALIAGSCLTIFRKAWGVKLMRLWSLVTIVLTAIGLTCLGIVAVVGLSLAADDFTASLQEGAEIDSAAELAVVVAFLLIFTVVNLGFAIFLAVWFRRADVMREIERW